MNLVELTLPIPKENLRFDDHLLERLEQAQRAGTDGSDTLRFWEIPTLAVVVGRSGNIAKDVYANACAAKGVPLLRRTSGGGAVVLGPGCLCFSLVLSMNRHPELVSVRRSYEIILGKVIEALGCPEVKMRGLSDLVFQERKISGNAQRRTGRALLHQGTMLYQFDATQLTDLIPFPARHPTYRHGRPHDQFVTNFPMAVDEFKSRVFKLWQE